MIGKKNGTKIKIKEYLNKNLHFYLFGLMLIVQLILAIKLGHDVKILQQNPCKICYDLGTYLPCKFIFQ